jgi:hypothetical protein
VSSYVVSILLSGDAAHRSKNIDMGRKSRILLQSLLVATLIACASFAQGQATSYIDLHDFGGTVRNADGKSGLDGEGPQAGITFDKEGNMYGTTSVGGPNKSGGTVWEITTTDDYLDLHDFGGTVINADGKSGLDGNYPQAGVTFDSSGNMYGVTFYGGPSNYGMVWEITTEKAYLDLHDFGGTTTNVDGKTGPDGMCPNGTIVFDSEGNMYGTANIGGGNNYEGMVWEITKLHVYSDIHDFGGKILNSHGVAATDGFVPNAGITFDAAGDMFGTTSSGAANSAAGLGDGMVWEITKLKAYVDVHDFGGTIINANGKSGPDGLTPTAAVCFDSAGNMFGTATYGGANNAQIPTNQNGMVWEITKAGSYKDLHDFGGSIINSDGVAGIDGGYPSSPVILDSAGNLFGTAGNAGPNASGLVFEITTAGVYKDLHDFGALALKPWGALVPDGQYAGFGLTFGPNGNLFGTTLFGGDYDQDSGGDGMAWELGAAVIKPTLTVAPATVWGGNSSIGTVKLPYALSNPLPIKLASSSPSAKVPASISVPAGVKSYTFTITTTPVAVKTSPTISATINAVEGSATASALLVIDEPVLSYLQLSPDSLRGGLSVAGTVDLSATAPTAGIIVNLVSSSSVAKLPATVLVPAGSKSVGFTITTVLVSAIAEVTITASSGGWYATVKLAVAPPSLYSVTLAPTSVTGGSSTTGTVTIDAVAPTGGMTVALTSSSVDATVPATVFIPAGKASATFTVKTLAVSVQIIADIKASLGGDIFTAFLTIGT